jgi:hypothetical protein
VLEGGVSVLKPLMHSRDTGDRRRPPERKNLPERAALLSFCSCRSSFWALASRPWIHGVPEMLKMPPATAVDRSALMLEHALVLNRIIHIHGWVLSGKSCLAAEFAQWLSSTSSEPYPVLFIRITDCLSTHILIAYIVYTAPPYRPSSSLERDGRVESRRNRHLKLSCVA